MGIHRFKRLLDLIMFIQANVRVTIYDIMNELNVSRSTAFRDLKMLVDCGIPCAFHPEKGYQINSTYRLPADGITPFEAMALAQLLSELKLDRTNNAKHGAAKAIQKILLSLPQAAREVYQKHAREHLTIIDQDCSLHDATAESLSLLFEAVEENIPVVCEYRSKQNHRKQIRLHPYHLIADVSEWHLWAKVFPDEELLMLDVSRLHKLVQADGHFNQPMKSTRYAWKSAWRIKPDKQLYNVEIAIKHQAPQYFRATKWHESQTQGFNESGQFVLKFEISGLEEIADWIWQNHKYLQVIYPLQLKEIVTNMAKQVLVELV